MKIKMIFIIIATILLTSCKESNLEGDNTLSLKQEANNALLVGDYSKAISLYKELLNRSVDKDYYKKRLTHAYAGCAGFSANYYYDAIKEIEKLPEESDIILFLDKMINIIPPLNKEEENCLDNAIEIYKDLEKDIKHSFAKDSNFEWGALHSYRLMNRIHKIKNFLKEELIKNNGENITLKDFVRISFHHTDKVLEDTYVTYLMMEHSYKPFRKLAGKFSGMLKELFQNEGVYFYNLNYDKNLAPVAFLKLFLPYLDNDYKIFFYNLLTKNPYIIDNILFLFIDKVEYENIKGFYKDFSLKLSEKDQKEEFNKIREEFKKILALKPKDNLDLETEEDKMLIQESKDSLEDFNYGQSQAVAKAIKEEDFNYIEDFYFNDEQSEFVVIKEVLLTKYKEKKQSELDSIMNLKVSAIIKYLSTDPKDLGFHEINVKESILREEK